VISNAPDVPSFQGTHDGVRGPRVQVFHESNNWNQFAKTVEALGEYFAKNMKYAGDMMPLTRDLTNPEATKPTAIAKGETDREIVFEWEKEMTDYITRKNVLNSNLKASYIIIWGQCSKPCVQKSSLRPIMKQKTPHVTASGC